MQTDEPVEARAISWNAVLSTYLPALILALGTGIALPAIPHLARSFHVGFAEASGVTTVFLIGTLMGTVPTGWLIDRFGRRRVMLAGPLLTAVMAFLMVTAQSFPELLVYRFFDGFASQMWLVGRLAGISHSAAPSQRGKQVSWMYGMDSTGQLAGPLAGGFIATAWGPRAPFFAYGVMALATLIPGYLYLRDTPRNERSATQASTPTRGLSIREVVMPRLVYFGVVLFAALARGPVQADLLYLYVAYAYHLSPQDIGLLATAAACISLPISLLSGWMLDRFGRKRAMVPGFAGVTVTMGLLAVVAIVRISFIWYLVIFLTGIGFQALTGGSIQTIGADVAPPEARGKFLGLWRFAGQGGTAISPIMFAFLSSAVNYGASFAFISVSAFTVAWLVARLVPESADGTIALPVQPASRAVAPNREERDGAEPVQGEAEVVDPNPAEHVLGQTDRHRHGCVDHEDHSKKRHFAESRATRLVPPEAHRQGDDEVGAVHRAAGDGPCASESGTVAPESEPDPPPEAPTG